MCLCECLFAWCCVYERVCRFLFVSVCVHLQADGRGPNVQIDYYPV